MGKYDKEYEAFQIFEQIQGDAVEEAELEPEEKPQQGRTSAKETPYYEIEYDSCPMPGVGKFVLKSDKISASSRELDPVRQLFNQMRDMARENRFLTFSHSKFYDKRIQQENAKLFLSEEMPMREL